MSQTQLDGEALRGSSLESRHSGNGAQAARITGREQSEAKASSWGSDVGRLIELLVTELAERVQCAEWPKVQKQAGSEADS